jgi:alpha-L-rhamnosidase
MKKYLRVLLDLAMSFCSLVQVYSSGGILPSDLKTERMVNPLGVDVLKPAFSWVLTSTERGQKQLGYQVLVASTEADLTDDKANLWNTGHVQSGEEINIIYEGPALLSGTRYYWKVRVWDKNNIASDWSVSAWWEMGLLNSSDWQGKWIGTTTEMASPLFRKDFITLKTIKKATAHVYGLGWYELHLNGSKVGDQVLTPANMDYSKRNLYESFDVTSYLKDGGNTVGLWLANGYGATYSKYGWRWIDSKRAILQLNIEFTDGSKMSVVTDETWKTTSSQILSAEMYNGETYDATQEKTGWDTNGYNDVNWENVTIKSAPPGKMQSNMSTPVRVAKIIKPVLITQPSPGIYVFDLGQNIAGWVRIHVKGATRGTKIVMRHAETINSDGTLNTRTNRKAEATDSYTCKGGTQEEIYEPRFTYHGFRYVEVKGYPGTPDLMNIEGCAIHADVEFTGKFFCSSDLLNKIHSNFQWTMLNNMVSIVTDNPVRDERTPCQMDWNCLYEAAIQNFDAEQYFKSWFNDILKGRDIPVWSAGQVLGPWLLYQYYGDKRILESFYISSKGEVDYCIANAIRSKFWAGTFGDWCPPFSGGTYEKSFSEGEVVNTTLYYYITKLLSQISGILGKTADSASYALKAKSIMTDFNSRIFNDTTNVYGSGKQITYIMPLLCGMVPEGKKTKVFNNLVTNILGTSSGHFGTGIYGTAFLPDILCDYGRPDVAYTLLNQTTHPSFGDQINNYGATTTWEQWDVIKTGKEMETYDHAMFSGPDKTFYTRFGGIRPLTPGYRTISIKPYIPKGLTYVKSSIKTVMGMVISNWDKSGSVYTHNITIPTNTSAIVYIPGTNSHKVYENGIAASKAKGVHYLRIENNYIVYNVESGSYLFSYGKPKKRVKKSN